MLPENPVMVCVGIVLVLASRFSKWRNAPFGGKPLRPITDTERVILFSFGLLGVLSARVHDLSRRTLISSSVA
jgi:hypothetical protein